jgi:hypothetical protein
VIKLAERAWVSYPINTIRVILEDQLRAVAEGCV